MNAFIAIGDTGGRACKRTHHRVPVTTPPLAPNPVEPHSILNSAACACLAVAGSLVSWGANGAED